MGDNGMGQSVNLRCHGCMMWGIVWVHVGVNNQMWVHVDGGACCRKWWMHAVGQ